MATRYPLYQVEISDRHGRPVRVGPAMHRSVIDEFVSTIEKAEKSGKERHWHEPRAVLAQRDN